MTSVNSELFITDVVTCNIRGGARSWGYSPAGKSRKMKSCFAIMDTRLTNILCLNGTVRLGRNIISVKYVIKVNKDKENILILSLSDF